MNFIIQGNFALPRRAEHQYFASQICAEINKSRKLLPVRKLLDVAGNAIQILKPVFLMSPLSVAQYLAPGRLKFDLLLIDEASQVRPEDALGAVARADQIVVVGDAKQLPPTNFFNRLVADGDDAWDDDSSSDGTPLIGAMESILSLCDATLSTKRSSCSRPRSPPAKWPMA